MAIQSAGTQRLWLPPRRKVGSRALRTRTQGLLNVQAAANGSQTRGDSRPNLPVTPVWKRVLVHTAQVTVGAMLVAIVSDILQFLGSKPPWDAEEWRSLTVNLDPDLTLPAPKRINPTIIYDRHKVEIARFASNAIPLNQVRTQGDAAEAAASTRPHGNRPST